MPNKLTIAVELADNHLATGLMNTLSEVPNVTAVQWFDSMGEKGKAAVKNAPEIIVIDDNPDWQQLNNRLALLRESFPAAAYFIVSSDQSPKHIIDVMKIGVAEYLVTPIDAKVLHNAIEDIRAKLANAGKIARGSVYSFISSKGGLGASFVAVNTAYALAQKKDVSVALFDLSLQAGDASVMLDVIPEITISDLVKNFHRMDASFLSAAMSKAFKRLDFLAAPTSPDDCQEINGDHIAAILELGKKLYDHLVIDCSSMLISSSSLAAFDASEKIFVVIDLSVPAIRNAARLCELLDKHHVPSSKVEVIANRFIKGGTLSLAEVEKTLEKHVSWLFPNDFKTVISSVNKGIPLLKFSPGCPLAKNLTGFAEKLIKPQAGEKFRGIRGTFGRAI
ncbi:MAG: AAA family ATPase [Syntrophotaleaceae bacterium]